MYSYSENNSNIRKNNFDVFIRKHNVDWDQGPDNITGFALGTGGSSGKNEYVKTGYTSVSDIGFCMVGNGNEKPTMKNSAGQSINLNTGVEFVVSENTEMSFEDLNVDADNYLELRDLAASGNVDVLFINLSKVTSDAGTTAKAFGASNLKLSVFLEVSGNEYNKVVIQAKKESDISENVILPISVTS